MADYPMFSVADNSGIETDWAREGEIRKYVEGLRVRIKYVYAISRFNNEKTKNVLEIELEKSTKRSSGIAPGPDNYGFELPAAWVAWFTTLPLRMSEARIVSLKKLTKLEWHELFPRMQAEALSYSMTREKIDGPGRAYKRFF